MPLLELSGILLLSGLTRCLFLLSDSSDLDAHLWLIRLRKRLGSIGRHDVDDALVPGIRGYPPLPHQIVACFPERTWPGVGRALNIAYDLLAVAAVYSLAWLVFERVWGLSATGLLSAAGLTTLVYATSPILHPVTARLKAIGGRTLGSLLTLLYFACFGAAFLVGWPLLYAGCIAIGLLILLASQFAMQVLVSSSVVLSLLYFDATPVLVLVATFAIGIVVPQLGIRQLLQRKWAHYRWYVAYADKGTTATDRNRLKDLLLLPVYLVTKPRKFANVVFLKSTPTIAAYSMPPLVVLLYWTATDWATLQALYADEWFRYASALSIAGACAFTITSLKPFLFLGQAERYFEYAAAPLCLVFLRTALERGVGGEAMILLVVGQLGIVLTIFLSVVLQSGQLAEKIRVSRDTALDEAVAALEQHPGPINALTIPTKLSYNVSVNLDRSDANYYYYSFAEPGRGMRYMQEDHVEHHLIRPDFGHFRTRYGINTVVVDKRTLAFAAAKGLEYPVEMLDIVFENANYAVYSLPSVEVNTAA